MPETPLHYLSGNGEDGVLQKGEILTMLKRACKNFLSMSSSLTSSEVKAEAELGIQTEFSAVAAITVGVPRGETPQTLVVGRSREALQADC